MNFDHGMLNIPFAKRSQTLFGETRAQFDKRMAAEHRAIAKRRHDSVKQARAAVAALSDDQVRALIPMLGVTTLVQARKKLKSHASWEPTNLLRVLGEQA